MAIRWRVSHSASAATRAASAASSSARAPALSTTNRSGWAGWPARNRASLRAELVRFFVATETGQRGGQLVSAALQFAAPLVGGSRRRKVGDTAGGQRVGQNLLCRGMFSIDV